MDHSQLIWRKSSRSDNGGLNCVEIAATPQARIARDSKKPAGPVLTLDPRQWAVFVEHVKMGKHDLA